MENNTKAYDFSAVAPSGQTLYYKIISGTTNVEISPEYYGNQPYSVAPSGDLIIPSEVVHNGTNYSVTRIGKMAFGYCDNLKSVTIPGSVTSFDDDAFFFCTQLLRVTMTGSAPSITKNSFLLIPKEMVVLVSSDRAQEYLQDPEWSVNSIVCEDNEGC